MDDLLVAMSESKLRWRGVEKPAVKAAAVPTESNSQEKLMELAFRMGQGSVASQATPQASSATPTFPALIAPLPPAASVEE